MDSKTVKVEGFAEAERHLERLPLELRGPVVKAGLRAAGNAVVRRAKQLCPPPGYPGDKPGLKALVDTLGTEIREYSGATVAVVGPKRPAGSHGWVVEHGHRIAVGGTLTHAGRKTPPKSKRTGKAGEGTVAGTVAGRPFMEPASLETRPVQSQLVLTAIKKATEKSLRG